MGEDRGRMTEDWGRRGFAVFRTGAGLTSGQVFALLMTEDRVRAFMVIKTDRRSDTLI